MELYQLEYFEAVARHENVSKAAEELHISQPALSKAIAKLESELGVNLFDRVGKRLSLNEQGAFFRDSAAQLLMHVQESTDALREFAGAREGTVNVVVRGPQKEALSCTMAFMRENPSVFVTFDVQHSHDKNSTAYDADVVFAPVGMPFSASVGVPYAERDLKLAVPEDHWLEADGPVDLAALKDEPFAFLTRPYEYYELSYRLCLDSGFTPNVRFVTGSKPALLDFVRAGMGVGLVDSYMTRWGGVDGARIIALERESVIRSLCFACRKPDAMTPVARKYLDFVFEYFDVPKEKLSAAVFDR